MCWARKLSLNKYIFFVRCTNCHEVHAVVHGSVLVTCLCLRRSLNINVASIHSSCDTRKSSQRTKKSRSTLVISSAVGRVMYLCPESHNTSIIRWTHSNTVDCETPKSSEILRYDTWVSRVLVWDQDTDGILQVLLRMYQEWGSEFLQRIFLWTSGAWRSHGHSWPPKYLRNPLAFWWCSLKKME